MNIWENSIIDQEMERAYNHIEWNFFHSNNEMFQASKSKWIYVFYVVALNIFYLIFINESPFEILEMVLQSLVYNLQTTSPSLSK